MPVIGFVTVFNRATDVHRREQGKNERLQERNQQLDQVHEKRENDNQRTNTPPHTGTAEIIGNKNQA